MMTILLERLGGGMKQYHEEEKIKAFTVVVVEQAKNKYNLRNRVVNHDQGKPAGMFIKEKGAKEIRNGGTPKMTVTKQIPNTPKNQEPQKKDVPQVEVTKVSISPTNSFDITNALSQMKISVHLLEMMKITEYKSNTLALIYEVPSSLGVARDEKKSKLLESGKYK